MSQEKIMHSNGWSSELQGSDQISPPPMLASMKTLFGKAYGPKGKNTLPTISHTWKSFFFSFSLKNFSMAFACPWSSFAVYAPNLFPAPFIAIHNISTATTLHKKGKIIFPF